ncbi:prion-like-(Q/N-rich) domain-bearing protein 25 [Saccostrea echinata]|uniref:prion-like-(Q/N-rich) domain-bearing protein 25 n=1 Tax=Saccostrea echinata TaxID=191078 RepID=UPI002A7F74BA|nr:prion-like-(Q/N-rich) domain-bearing protein 25 [Saccostrea echinata]
MLEFNGQCLKAGRQILQSCYHQSQCTGTENATVCKSIGLGSVCVCREGTVEYDGRCLESGKKMFQTCDSDIQCTGTPHGGVCGENNTCTCDIGFIQIYNECARGNVTLGSPCIKSSQCTGTKHSSRCIDGECFCNDGFRKISLPERTEDFHLMAPILCDVDDSHPNTNAVHNGIRTPTVFGRD